jgi:hypothetical protein
VKLEDLVKAHPEAERVEIWAEEETRLGLKPVTRRVWAPVGKRPSARFKRAYEWTYLYGFVHPRSGRVFWMILPTVNTEMFSLALREFAKEVGARWEPAKVGASCWWWTKPAGTREVGWTFRKGYTSSSCRRALRS